MAVTRIIQYQREAKPLTTPAAVEQLTLDKWGNKEVNLFRKKTVPALAVSACVIVPLENYGETITLDKFLQPQQGVPRKPISISRLSEIGQVFPVSAPPEDITIDKWLGEYPEILNRIGRRVPLDTPLMQKLWEDFGRFDMWEPHLPDRVYRRRPQSWGGEETTLFYDSEIFSISRLLHNVQIEILRPKRVTPSVIAMPPEPTVPPEVFTVDKWRGEQLDVYPRRKAPGVALRGETVFQLGYQEQNTIDKWLGEYIDRYYQKPVRYHWIGAGDPRYVFTEFTSMDKWFRETATPVRLRVDQLSPTALRLPAGQYTILLISPDIYRDTIEFDLYINMLSDITVYMTPTKEFDVSI